MTSDTAACGGGFIAFSEIPVSFTIAAMVVEEVRYYGRSSTGRVEAVDPESFFTSVCFGRRTGQDSGGVAVVTVQLI